ncbi:zinc finger BED domain-containing protein DAYSLEEPER-like [Mercurialis annua]|uniref:zinc finger BED domain-containing protein DAYSLEEPER-like n=1 Tax=Mercurialis annua TaxID=3986 RepID=UPI0024AE5D9F|nr:zinc finger BED domain-containing protein DAYSLEEPER-like [Mercurialis annua]
MALKGWLICGIDYIEVMAAKMLEKFNKYWSQIHGIMGVAIVLDPRYKLKLLQYYFPLIYGDIRSIEEIDKIQKHCYDLLAEYSSKSKMSWYNGFDSQSSNDIFSQSSVLDVEEVDPMSKYDLFVASESNNENVKTELDHYLEERVIPRKVDFDILSWWKNAHKYPTLQMIARDILAIPVSTVASESAFSTSGRFVTPHRSRLHPNTLEALMCAQNWLWAEIKDSCSTGHSDCCTFYEEYDTNDKVNLLLIYFILD